MVNIDLTKEWKQYLCKYVTDYLVIDLYYITVELIQTGNSLLTLSILSRPVYKELLKRYILKHDSKIIEFYDIHIDNYFKSLDQIFSFLFEKYKERIILIQIYDSYFYITKDNQLLKFAEQNKLQNKNHFLSKIYEYIINRFKFDYVLTTPKISFATQVHKWGLAPAHYVKEYYDILYDQIKIITTAECDLRMGPQER